MQIISLPSHRLRLNRSGSPEREEKQCGLDSIPVANVERQREGGSAQLLQIVHCGWATSASPRYTRPRGVSLHTFASPRKAQQLPHNPLPAETEKETEMYTGPDVDSLLVGKTWKWLLAEFISQCWAPGRRAKDISRDTAHARLTLLRRAGSSRYGPPQSRR